MAPDDPDRLTKPQAAARLDVTERTIEQFVKDGKLDPRRWRPAGGGQWRTVFLAEDVARLAAERQGGPPAPFLVRDPAPANGNGHPSRAVAQTRPSAEPSGEAIVRAVFAMLQGMLTGPPALEGPNGDPKDPKGPKSAEPTWIGIPEAAALLGRSQAYVRRQIKAGVLHAERDRTVKVRRKDLEQL